MPVFGLIMPQFVKSFKAEFVIINFTFFALLPEIFLALSTPGQISLLDKFGKTLNANIPATGGVDQWIRAPVFQPSTRFLN